MSAILCPVCHAVELFCPRPLLLVIQKTSRSFHWYSQETAHWSCVKRSHFDFPVGVSDPSL